MSAPLEQVEESLKLEADAECHLWEVHLKVLDPPYNVVHFWNGPEVTWQGNTYEALACQVRGIERNSDGQTAKPTLTVANPDNAFGAFAAEGYFDLATVIRKTVLRAHLDANANIFEQRVWICGRPSRVQSPILELELRDLTDNPVWRTPRRIYAPPTYPFVVL